MRSKAVLAAAAVLAAILMGAAGCAPAERAEAPAATSSQRHAIRGVVMTVPAEGKMVTVDHEEIPGVMRAMRMDLAVPGEADRELMKPGARFEATLVVENNAMWIEAVEVTGQAETPPEDAAAAHQGHTH